MGILLFFAGTLRKTRVSSRNFIFRGGGSGWQILAIISGLLKNPLPWCKGGAFLLFYVGGRAAILSAAASPNTCPGSDGMGRRMIW